MSAATGLPDSTVEILSSLAHHRTLTTEQVRKIHLPGRGSRWARQVMERLRDAGLADRIRTAGTPPRALWFVTETGARVAVESGGLDHAPKALRPEQAAGQLHRHTTSVNDAAIAFLKAARERGDDFGPLSWHHETVHPLTRTRGRRRRVLRADASFTYLRRDGDEVFVEQRFLEVDRATLGIDRLAGELSAYATLHRATDEHGEPLWRPRYPVFPPVICVLTGAPSATLERRRNATLALLRKDPEMTRTPEVTIHLAFLEDLQDHGPFAPIFRDPQKDGWCDWLGNRGSTR